MLLNAERARDIMNRDNLDGLIAQLPINVYYLSDYWGLFNTPGGYDAAYFAVFPRAMDQPATLILPALEMRRVESKGTWMPNVLTYSSPADDAVFEDGTPRGTDYVGWSAREGVELGELERRWVEIVMRLGRETSPDAMWALVRGIMAAGLDRGRLATDDTRITHWLAARSLKQLECVYQPQLFNEIRLVKSAAELQLLTRAARINEQSLLTAARALHEDATWDELENIYMMEMARQGGRGVYLTCGVGELPAGQARRGEPIMFDALGWAHRYHGDFGRCAVIGEPSPQHRARHQAICVGWEVAQEILKPGIRYSELSQAVGDAVRREGFAGFRDPVVHSLGLEHTDDPKLPGVQPQTKPDQTLQANMVVNVDMPHTEIGWGSVHMEDTVRITADGCERLGTADFSMVTV